MVGNEHDPFSGTTLLVRDSQNGKERTAARRVIARMGNQTERLSLGTGLPVFDPEE